MQQQLIFTNQVGETLDQLVTDINPSSVFVLVDPNTAQFVLPVLQADSKVIAAETSSVIQIPAGDIHKDLDTLRTIWQHLSDHQASRSALLINIGGGVITDMGGFAASTFKRGIHTINIPTSLLGAVDAAVGGKTAINFNGIKNQIGTFAPADAVIISSIFFPTLTIQETLSGYGEMIKHALLSSEQTLNDLLNYSIKNPPSDPDRLLALVKESVSVKENIVAQDPTEQNLRRSLNLGHTVGHAFEALALKRHSPIPHGYAVVWGIIVECILSNMLEGFNSEILYRLATYAKDEYGIFDITCDDYPDLLQFMSQDKKNLLPDLINFTLLKAPGDIVLDVTPSHDHITAALDIYRDIMGI